MIQSAIDRLRELCQTLPAALSKIPDEAFKAKPLAHKWSKQEVMGHLIDSATNNHHRFVRAQFENMPSIWYAQDNWNAGNFYQSLDKQHIISFWLVYNQHILAIIERLSAEQLELKCRCGGEEIYTLAFLINDYVQHIDHHLKQVI